MKRNLTASRVALGLVVLVVGGSFVWWFKNRPSYLLYQAHSQLGKGNQAAVIARFKRLLSEENLPKAEELKLRKALGEFYLEASGVIGTVVLRREFPKYQVEHPFIDLAKKEFDLILKEDPTDATAHFNVGRVLLVKGLEKFAIEEMQQAHAYDPRFPEPLYFLSLVYQERGEIALGRELALQALAIRPDYDRARWALVSAYMALGDNENALKEYNRLSEGFKKNPSIRSGFALYLARQNYWDRAAHEIEQALRVAPQNGWVRLDHGQILLMRGLKEEAAGEFSQAAALYKYSAWPLVWQARAYALRGQVGAALDVGRILSEALPRWPWSHVVAAWGYVSKGDDARALSRLTEALRLAPEFSEAIDEMAQIYMDKGQFQALGKLIRPLLDKKVNQDRAYSLLAESFYRQGNYSLAMDTAKTALEFNNRNPHPKIWLGLSQIKANQSKQGAQDVLEAYQLNDRDPNLKGVYAYSRALAGHTREGIDLISEVLSGQSHNAHLWLIQGHIFKMKKQWNDALQSYLRAVDIKPYLLEAHLGLIETYWETGKVALAKSTLQALMKINSKHRQVLKWRNRLQKS